MRGKALGKPLVGVSGSHSNPVPGTRPNEIVHQ